jgi:hypothetical protein
MANLKKYFRNGIALLDKPAAVPSGFLSAPEKWWHKGRFPGNKLPGYYPSSLGDFSLLSPGGGDAK